MQEPLAVVQLAEEPEPLTAAGLDAVVVAADGAAAPPAGFNAFRSPDLSHFMPLTPLVEPDRRPVRPDRQHAEWTRGTVQSQGAIIRAGRLSRGSRSIGATGSGGGFTRGKRNEMTGTLGLSFGFLSGAQDSMRSQPAGEPIDEPREFALSSAWGVSNSPCCCCSRGTANNTWAAIWCTGPGK